MDGATFHIPTLLQKATAIQIIDNHHVMMMIHQALAGLMARNNVPDPDRGKRAAIAKGTPSGENQCELELQRGNPPSLATARNASTDRTRSSLCMLVPFLAMATTAHAFSAAPGSPNFSNFPRKQTWVAPKALPELMNDMYQVHRATESAGTIGVFHFIGEGTRASKSSVDLKLMGLDSIVELRDGLPTTLAAYDAEGQEFPIGATVQKIHDGGAKSLSVTPLLGLMPFYVEEDGVVKLFNFGTDVEEAEDPNPTRLRYMKAYINILSGPNDNNKIDNNEITNIETDDASVVRCEETADMAVPEGEHGSPVQNTMVVCAAPTQSWKAEHSEKALPTDKVYLKLMGPHSIVEIRDGLRIPTTLVAYDAEGQEFPINATKQEIHDGGVKSLSVTPLSGLMPVYVEEDGAAKPFNFGTNVEEVKDPNPTSLCNMNAYLNIVSGPNGNNEITNIETDDASASVVRCEETADMAVQGGKHGSVSVDDRPWTQVEPESILASYVQPVMLLILTHSLSTAQLTQATRIGSASTQSLEAEHLEKALLTNEETEVLQLSLDVACVGAEDVRGSEETGSDAALRSAWFLPVPLLPTSTKADSNLWLLIVAGGIFLKFTARNGVSFQRPGQQTISSAGNGVWFRTEMSGQLSALKEMESGFTEMSGQLSALTSIVSSDSRNSESSNLRSDARKLQSPLSPEDPVPYRRACTSHRLDKADIYSKIIDHLDNDDEIYYNRGSHIYLRTHFGNRWASFPSGNTPGQCSTDGSFNSDPARHMYRVPGITGPGDSDKVSIYDPRRPGYFLHISSETVTAVQLEQDLTLKEHMTFRRHIFEPGMHEGGEEYTSYSGNYDLCCNPLTSLGAVWAHGHAQVWRVYEQSKCPYFEKFNIDANPRMEGFAPERTGFLRDFLEWEVGGVTDPANQYERRYADDRQDSLEIKFDVDISRENDGGISKGILGSYTLNIDIGLFSFEEWDYFEVRSSEYTNPENGCSRRHSIPDITLYQCELVNDKDGGYGDRDGWSVFRLISEVGDKCLSVDSYGVPENMKEVSCHGSSSLHFAAFLSEEDNSRFALRPYEAVENNKDVCFAPNGRHTTSQDCQDDLHFFSTSRSSPGVLELFVETPFTTYIQEEGRWPFVGRIIETTQWRSIQSRYRMIPLGFSYPVTPSSFATSESVNFMSSSPPGIMRCLTATVHKLFGFYFDESDTALFDPIRFSECDANRDDQIWYVELLEDEDDGYFQIRPKLYEGVRELCLGQQVDDGDAARLLSCGTTMTKFTEVSSMIQHAEGKCLYHDHEGDEEALIKICGSTSESYVSAVRWPAPQSG
ncbi:hypothetical protein THAOC_27551, partial [Thalassiosira oceanica]